MPYHRRRLPHVWQINREVFLTWCLDGAIPKGRAFPAGRMTSGREFVFMDRLLDTTQEGPTYLKRPEVANMVVEAIRYNDEVLRHYDLHAYVVMANHVHVLITALVPLPAVTRSLKGITSKRANAILCRTGQAFWQVETYDRLVRDEREFEKIRNYIEMNPVRAGLVHSPEEYRWSSGWPAGGPAAGQGACPTILRA